MSKVSNAFLQIKCIVAVFYTNYLSVGWLLQYKDGADSTIVLVNEGAAGRQSVVPEKYTVTSSEEQQSLMWIGRDGPLEIRKTTQLDNNDLFFTTSVTIKNIGTVPILDIYCEWILCTRFLNQLHLIFLLLKCIS
jgi:hypothetical protein